MARRVSCRSNSKHKMELKFQCLTGTKRIIDMSIPLCGCGKECRYIIKDGEWACNKYARCPDYDQLRGRVLDLRNKLSVATDYLHDLEAEWRCHKDETRCGYAKEYAELKEFIALCESTMLA